MWYINSQTVPCANPPCHGSVFQFSVREPTKLWYGKVRSSRGVKLWGCWIEMLSIFKLYILCGIKVQGGPNISANLYCICLSEHKTCTRCSTDLRKRSVNEGQSITIYYWKYSTKVCQVSDCIREAMVVLLDGWSDYYARTWGKSGNSISAIDRQKWGKYKSKLLSLQSNDSKRSNTLL